MSLRVSEVFGPTIQGEGPLVGLPATFLRLMGCNLSCSWCDTPYTWDASRFDLAAEGTTRTAADLVDDIVLRGEHLLVISGGEPMLQQDKLVELLQLLPAGWRVQVETAGTIEPAAALTRFVEYVVSIKLDHSGNGPERYQPLAIEELQATRKVLAWKFVVQSEDDLPEVDHLVRRHQLHPVYVMPEGVVAGVLQARLSRLAPHIIERGYAITPRLHIDLFGNTRGT